VSNPVLSTASTLTVCSWILYMLQLYGNNTWPDMRMIESPTKLNKCTLINNIDLHGRPREGDLEPVVGGRDLPRTSLSSCQSLFWLMSSPTSREPLVVSAPLLSFDQPRFASCLVGLGSRVLSANDDEWANPPSDRGRFARVSLGGNGPSEEGERLGRGRGLSFVSDVGGSPVYVGRDCAMGLGAAVGRRRYRARLHIQNQQPGRASIFFNSRDSFQSNLCSIGLGPSVQSLV
jgi:hypothetical protein